MSLIAPLGLLLGGLAAPLVALYFLRLRRRRVKVPSILLWQAFHKSERLASPFQRFRRNWLLLLQLLALLLLVLAVARPFLHTDAPLARSVALVLDTSASMGATDLRPTRLGAAVAEATALIDGLGPSDEAMLVVAGPRTEVAVPFTRDRAALRAALDRLAPTEAEGSLREGLQLAVSMARTRPGVEVVVLSDGGGEPLSDVPTAGATVRFAPIGRSDRNAAILAVDLRRSPTSELVRELFVTVQNFGADDAPGTVEVYLDQELIGLRTESLPPDTPVSMVFDVGGDRTGTVRIALDVPEDALPADDVAWLALSPLSRRRVLLVGGDALTARALAADPRVALTRVPAGNVDAAALDRVDAAVFADGVVPPGLDGRSYAVLGPLPGSPVTFGEEARAPVVLGWRRTHPVLRFVEWDQIVIARGQAVTDPGPLVPIVDGDAGPLVLAGEIAGGRVVQLAFDPLRSDLPMRVAWPVTLLNAVGWLTERAATGEAAQAIPTGTALLRRLPEGVGVGDVAVSGPGGEAVDFVVADELLRVRDTTRVGVYEVRVAGVRSRFSANLVSPEESDIAPRAALALADTQVEAARTAAMGGRRELWRPLALAGVLLLLLEWFLWNRRRAA